MDMETQKMYWLLMCGAECSNKLVESEKLRSELKFSFISDKQFDRLKIFQKQWIWFQSFFGTKGIISYSKSLQQLQKQYGWVCRYCSVYVWCHPINNTTCLSISLVQSHCIWLIHTSHNLFYVAYVLGWVTSAPFKPTTFCHTFNCCPDNMELNGILLSAIFCTRYIWQKHLWNPITVKN